MSTARPAVQRRTAAPIAPAQQPKTQITLEEWEAKAPLSDLALKSVTAIQMAMESAPLPLKVSLYSIIVHGLSQATKSSIEVSDSSRPSTPNLRYVTKPGSVSRPSTPVLAITRAPASHALDPKQPIQTPQQFYDWFAQIDRSVAHSQEAHFRAHVAMVTGHLDTTEMLLQHVNEVEREVDGMLEGWRTVEQSGRSIKDACERLLQERVRHVYYFHPAIFIPLCRTSY